MREEKDDIEQLFGDELGGFEFQPTADMEKKLMASINFVPTKKRRGFFWLMSLAAISLLLFCVVNFSGLTNQYQARKNDFGKPITAVARMPKNTTIADTNVNETSLGLNNTAALNPFTASLLANKSVNAAPWNTQNKAHKKEENREGTDITSTKTSKPYLQNGNGEISDHIGLLNDGSIPLSQKNTDSLPKTVALNDSLSSIAMVAEDTTNLASASAGLSDTLGGINPAPSGLNSKPDTTIEQAKNRISLTYTLNFPTTKNTEIAKKDSTWSAQRLPIMAAQVDYAHIFGKHIAFSGGIKFERSKEEWKSNFLYEGWIIKDTIIGGEPATITYMGILNNQSAKSYTLSSLSVPLSVGYLVKFGKFNVGLFAGGTLNTNFIKQRTTLLNNTLVNDIKRETTFSFSPETTLNLDYLWGRMGIGVALNYNLQNFKRSSLLEQMLMRNNVGCGVRLIYTL